MRTIVAGSRDITDYAEVSQAIRASGLGITLVVSGGAPGVDRLGERWAFEHENPHRTLSCGLECLRARSRCDRNEQMAENAEALVAIMLRSGTRGTQDMIKRARARGLKVFVHLVG